MKNFPLILNIFFVLLMPIVGVAQNDKAPYKSRSEGIFTVRGQIRESDSRAPIKNVDVQVNSGKYTTTNINGDFRIDVKIGDEIIITHNDFETIYYTIKSNERILVEVLPKDETKQKETLANREISFNSLIDSAEVYKNVSAEKSIQFITESIKKSTSVKQNAEAFEVLGDVYTQWKQYDLAIFNYKISLNNTKTNAVNLKLANAYYLNKDYGKSLEIYNAIDKSELSNYQLVTFYEKLGDLYFRTEEFDKSIKGYNAGLVVASEQNIKAKVTDLNAKLGQSFNESGNTEVAEGYLNNSLNLASKQGRKKEVEAKVQVADFQNTTRNYQDEIETRKDIINNIEEITRDSVITNESPLTLQKQNYKIGNAYFLQNNLEEAIPFLNKSIEEADEKEDLVVKKDATRKLSDVHAELGNFALAKETFDEYTKVVDELYIKKQQEITQAARFNQRLTEKQTRINMLEVDKKLTISQMEVSAEKAKRQQLIIYSLLGGLLLVLLTTYLMYKSIKQQKLANNLLALKSLRSQMNPHFIFNALNSVNSFIATNDERTANKYLSDFSKLMRAVLENSEEDFIPLEKEIQLLELYTKLEHFRFKDKFEYNITVDKTIDVEAYKIPPMLLQPYIENAVWHGLRYKTEKGQLDISITKKAKGIIEITIADDGIGRKKSKSLKTENQQKHNSKGLGNIKKRVSILNEMYKDKVDVFITDNTKEGDVGTKVVVTLKKD